MKPIVPTPAVNGADVDVVVIAEHRGELVDQHLPRRKR